MMNFLYIFLFLFSYNTLGQSSDIQNIITSPVTSQRCKDLLLTRSQKIRVKQKLDSLILRNKELLNRTKPEQKSVISRLTLSGTSLSNQLRLANIQIKSMEENIVRKGCPGINL